MPDKHEKSSWLETGFSANKTLAKQLYYIITFANVDTGPSMNRFCFADQGCATYKTETERF